MDRIVSFRPVYPLKYSQSRYYNGTTTIQIEPQDYDDDTDCDTFTDGDIKIEYENSILAIVKPNSYYEDPHDFEFGLTYYDKTTNITPTSFSSGNSPVNDVVSLQSVREWVAKSYHFSSVELTCCRMDSYTSQGLAPWRFNSSLVANSMYSFTGYLNNSESYDGISIQFNHSTCRSTEPKVWSLGTQYLDTSIDGTGKSEFPTVSGRFDNNSAFLEIRGTFSGFPAQVGSNDETALGGLVTVQFHGQIDNARSDELLFRNDTPQWKQTLGFSRMLFDSHGYVVNVGALLYGMLGLCVSAIFL